MTAISPLLQNRLNATGSQGQSPNNRHEEIYQDLQKRAHEAKPNEAKAKLVKEGILGNPITDTIDIAKDTGNFFKAVKTGNMGDNSLGRINDLGLKIGAGLIATFLALNSKTKTQSIMRFVGGATFIAMMDLWPKLFINLPARLVHGFRIDRKYISAQGDKKDFFLDNQFLVWDAYPEEQLRKDAKKAGIDYDSENGKEKIQRKMQKTALQNRTLWMATAGFATPLLTSMIGNFVEPKVEEAVIEHGIKATKKIADTGMAQFIKNTQPEIRNASELESLLGVFKTGNIDEQTFIRLAEMLSPVDFLKEFQDSDDARLFKNLKSDKVAEELQAIYEKLRKLDKASLEEQLGLVVKGKISKTKLTPDEIKQIVAQIGDDLTPENIGEVLKRNKIAPESIATLLKNTKTNNTDFIQFVIEYNKGPIAQLRSRLKAYGKLANPIVGSKAESATTAEYSKAMKRIFKSFGINPKDYKAIENADELAMVDKLSGAIRQAVAGKNDQEYQAFLESISMGKMDERVIEIIEKLQDKETLDAIGIDAKTIEVNKKVTANIEGLNKAILGGDFTSMRKALSDMVELKKIDLDAVRLRMILCANFERRLAAGEFGELSSKELAAARRILYDGNLAISATVGNAANRAGAKKLAGLIFKEGSFNKAESDAIEAMGHSLKPFINKDTGEITGVLDVYMKKFRQIIQNGKSEKYAQQVADYTSSASLVGNIKNFARKLNNNKKWMKAVAPMTAALIAITLLVQPFFGKIDKEFSKEGKNGGAK